LRTDSQLFENFIFRSFSNFFNLSAIRASCYVVVYSFDWSINLL